MNNTHETLLDVTGMSCASCVRRVTNALATLPGVTTVDVRLQHGKVLVRHDPTQTTVNTLVATLDRAGYGSSLAAA